MRLFIVIALCLAVASANYANKNRFNRLLRNLQNQQDQQQRYNNQELSYDDEDSDEQQQQDDEDDYYQQQQCSRNRNQPRLNLDDDDDQDDERNNNNNNNNNDSNERDDEDDSQQESGNESNESGQRRRNRQNQQQRRRQQQNRQSQNRQNQQNNRRRQQQRNNQCQPKYQLLPQLERPNGKLASKLYKQAKQENDDKNTVVSPAAVQLALAALQRGARGNTKRQIQNLIGAGLNQQQERQANAALQQILQGNQNQNQQQQNQDQDQDQDQDQENGQNQQAKIKTTTTIIINQRSRAQQKFIQAVKTCLNAQVKKCNFQRQPQQCRQQINRYVAQKTNQKLQNTVPQDAITENTKLIVVNTAQLKARWGRQFRQQQQTKQGRFYPLGCQQPKPVQVLQSRGQFNYYEDDQLQVVGIPTQRQELTLYVIVPKDKQGLNEIEKQQIENGQQLKELLDAADQQRERIDLELPKFQIKHKIDAKQTLRKQGARDAFDADEADLSGINGGQQQQQQNQERRRRQNQDSDEDQDQNDQDNQQQTQQQLHVNKLIHQATIKVDERGISAARPNRNQHQQQNQNEQETDENDEDQDEEDQQLSREQLFEEIFGQRRGQQGQQGQRRHRRQQNQQGNERRVKVNRAFAFAVKHNQSNQIVLVGRVVDATQKPRSQQQQNQNGRQQQQRGQQSLNGVDQE